jgi:sRNA-binding protein
METPFSSLFTPAELRAMQEGWERRQAAERDRKIAEMKTAHEQVERERDKAVPEKKFIYRPRTTEQWAARANQPTHRRWEKVHGHYVLTQQERARLAAKARILVEIVQSGEFPGCTVAELAEASGMSVSWVRKHLKAAGIAAAKPERMRLHGVQP